MPLYGGELFKSIGHHAHYGMSAGFDMLEAIESVKQLSTNDSSPISILLINPGDIRHILATIAKRRRHLNKRGKSSTAQQISLPPINFYILESPIESLARSLLLLECINDFEVPIRQRASIFLEIFGNCLVQDRTSRYIEQLGHELRSFVCDGSGRLDGLVDLSLLKYKEKDDLERIFKSYSREAVFDMQLLRDHRLRGLYAERYDSRKNLADWDYQSHIRIVASIIHTKQYREWRSSGIAFELNDQTYTEANKTMMSYTEGTLKAGKDRGMKKEVKGFWSDIVCSPYFSFGVDCDTPNAHAEGLYEIINKDTGTEQHRHHTVEVAMYNLFSYLWEIETGSVYRMTKAHDIYSGLGAEARAGTDAEEVVQGEEQLPVIVEGDDEEEKEGTDHDADTPPPPPTPTPSAATSDTVPPQKNEAISASASAAEAEAELAQTILRAECIVESLAGVKIFPMVGTPNTVLNKQRFTNSFDAVFVSSRMAQCLDEDYLKNLLREDGAVLAVETGKFLVPLSAETRETLLQKEIEFAVKHGLQQMPAPVRRRRRDERDTEDDVVFFKSV